ncbi:hypothetical protein [Actinopolymorpha pittospori]
MDFAAPFSRRTALLGAAAFALPLGDGPHGAGSAAPTAETTRQVAAAGEASFGYDASGVVFPGPPPGHARGRVSGPPSERTLTLSNFAIEATWQVHGDSVSLARLFNGVTGQAVPVTSNGWLTLALADGGQITGADLRMTQAPRLVPVRRRGDSARLAERDGGKSIHTEFRYDKDGRTLEVSWTVTLRDGANNVQQEFSLRCVAGTFAITSLRLLDLDVPDARVLGRDDGNPVVLGPAGQETLFLGVEHPMARASITGNAVTVSLPRSAALAAGETWTSTTAFGVSPAGQLRRSFLYYLERERVHARRPFLHYQSWYDLKPPGLVIDPAQLSEAIEMFGTELTRRGASIDSFWVDDGWDYLRSPQLDPEPDLWSLDPTAFPDGFTEQQAEASAYGGASLSLWMSPFGGYGDSASRRMALNASKPADQRYGTHSNGRFRLSDPRYYERFRTVAFEMMDRYGVRGFKFDGIGGGLQQTGPNPTYLADYEALLQLMTDLRAHQPDVWINATVGTWGSPYWLWFTDSIWRDGEDAGQAGSGSPQQGYVNYRDSQTYRNLAAENPLFPVTGAMVHGIIFSDRASRVRADHDLSKASVRDEVSQDIRAYFALGLGLQELYVRHTLVAPDLPGAEWFWDTMAANASWSRANFHLLTDVHWVGGDPANGQVYGTAAWSAAKGTPEGMLMLRNPTAVAQTFQVDPGAVFELPAGSHPTYAFAERDDRRPTVVVRAGEPLQVTLAPYEVAVFMAAPSEADPTGQ